MTSAVVSSDNRTWVKDNFRSHMVDGWLYPERLQDQPENVPVTSSLLLRYTKEEKECDGGERVDPLVEPDREDRPKT